MKVLLPALLVIVAATSVAHSAECTSPIKEVKIPDGNTASKDELLAVRQNIQEQDAEFKKFADCLKTEQDAKITAGGPDMKDEQKTKIATEYTNRLNVEADKLQKMGDQLNVEIRNYKAKHAADAPAAPAAPPASR